jgi:serine/threonine protein kinase/Flp pilus assembly protein TadD
VFGFRLHQELGRGSFARVFLAEQAELAGRMVVLKVSAIDGDEPQTLAQLQQTNIVPIYSVHEDRRVGVRAVCMPYFGGASLSRVLRKLWIDTPRPTQGQQLVEALEAMSGSRPVAPVSVDHRETPDRLPDGQATLGRAGDSGAGVDSQSLKELAALPYAQAVASIVARLADALQHAHDRGVHHRDIKPSNILLCADGSPMLLDFNVARNLRSDQPHRSVGGTVAYMAPEHLRALADPGSGKSELVDHRADIYSLGMVLYEMLVGCSPFEHTASYAAVPPLVMLLAAERSDTVPTLREKRSDLPWTLESILRRCMAPEPQHRYQRAEHLAEDLRCFLADRPLRHAPEISLIERMRKWGRRHPRLTSFTTTMTAAAVLLVLMGATLFGRLAAAHEELDAAQAQERTRQFQQGTQRSLCLVNTYSDLQDHVQQGIAVCEATLTLYGILDGSDWQDRAVWQCLDPEARRALGEDARELLLLLAWARTKTSLDDPDTLRQALRLLEQGENIRGLEPSRALWEDRACYLQKLGEKKGAEAARERVRQIQPVTARDHYLLATAHAHQGRYTEAVRELDEALRINPRHYWSVVQRGICHQELGASLLAAADFGTCIGLWPDFAWSYFNRGYVLDRSGAKNEAIRDYSAALERDPAFVMAYLNRGLARLELSQHEEALADFDEAIELGRDDASVHAGRGVALEGMRHTTEADAAFAAGFARAEALPAEARQRIQWVYGFAVNRRLPANAKQAFEDVLRERPDHPQALYGRGLMEVEEGRTAEALRSFSRLLEIQPSFLEARRFRAILLARRGDFDGASQDVNECLQKDPNGGATCYAAACVAAHAVAHSTSPRARDRVTAQAVHFLEKAFSAHYGLNKAASDPDLEGIRQQPNFLALLKAYESLPRSQETRSTPAAISTSERD